MRAKRLPGISGQQKPPQRKKKLSGFNFGSVKLHDDYHIMRELFHLSVRV